MEVCSWVTSIYIYIYMIRSPCNLQFIPESKEEAVGISKHSYLSQYFNNLFHSAFHLSDSCALYYFHTHACTVGETSNTTVGSTTDNSSATTVPPMHSPAPRITSLPSVYQPLPSKLQQQPQTATPSQLQQPRGILYINYH